MHSRFALAVMAIAFLIALTALESAHAKGLRYCERPGPAGNYLAASANVSCRTARKVEGRVFSSRCLNRNRCNAYGFTCLAFWDGRYDRPFSYTHHGKCHASGSRRVEFDTG